ncbi:MAG: CRTAC1 family protein [Rhodothermales bacterium]
MFETLPRRKRLVVFTVTFALLFLAATIIAVWALSRPESTYQPGEDIEGLTAELARSLPPDYPRITFVDASREAGIDFRHFSGTRTSQLPEDMGSGAAWGDYDNDGWLDLYVVNEVGPLTLSSDEVAASPAHNVLYHNNGDGTFTDVSAQAGVDFRGWGMAAAWGDYDNDGRLDLFTSAYGATLLYHNNGDGTFTNTARAAGLNRQDGFWAGASWGDYNRDGRLDLYVAGYVKYIPQEDSQPSLQYDVETPASINPSAFEPERNLLYRNNGDGTFSEVADEAGVDNPEGRSLEAAWVDFDENGWPDLYVANDVSDNVLFRNRGDGTFEEISHRALVADYRGAMGIAVGDWDGDTDLDMFITHWIAQENALYNNMHADAARLGNPALNAFQFMDVADRFGLGQIALDYIGWGTSFFDYDNDGRQDLFVVNGSTFQQKEAAHLLEPMRDQLFWNRGAKEGFFEVSAVSGALFREEHVGRGAAFGDYDNDGDVDVFVVNHGAPGVLLRNEGGHHRRWLKVALEGRQSNRSAIGARLRVVAADTVQVRQVGTQSSYLSQNSLTEHFGVGTALAVDTLEVIWPNGLKQAFFHVQTNQTVRLKEGEEVR